MRNLFTQRVVRMWNSLPQRVVEVNSMNTLKGKLDTYMREKGTEGCADGGWVEAHVEHKYWHRPIEPTDPALCCTLNETETNVFISDLPVVIWRTIFAFQEKINVLHKLLRISSVEMFTPRFKEHQPPGSKVLRLVGETLPLYQQNEHALVLDVMDNSRNSRIQPP